MLYSTWNGNNYTPFEYVSTNGFLSDDSGKLFIHPNNTIYFQNVNIKKTNVSFSNQSYNFVYTFNNNNNNFNQFTWTIDPSGIYKIYVNGVLVNTLTNVKYPNAVSRTNNYIGYSNSPLSYLDGEVVDFRAFNRTLTLNEVNTVYNTRYYYYTSGETGTIGCAGPFGSIGDTGFCGYDADIGNPGITGDTGVRGIIGPIEPISTTGITGSTGHFGVRGIIGDIGVTGPTGVSGYIGNPGPAGITNVTGPSEVSGYIGNSGPAGITNVTGPSGVSGYIGNHGPAGITNVTGPTGVSGYIGNPGPAGITNVTGPTGVSGYIGNYGPTGISGFYGPSGISGLTGYSGYTGIGYVGHTGPDIGMVGPTGPHGIYYNIPSTQYVINDNMDTTRKIFTKNIPSNMYVTDSPKNIISNTNGNTSNDIIYTFGKSKDTGYMAIGGITNNYGTLYSRNTSQWSSVMNTSSNVPCRIIWDGLKWIYTDSSRIQVSYNDISFVPITINSAVLSSIAYNNIMYVGIGTGGIFYSYDSLNWYNSSSGTSLINNQSNIQIGKVVWNGHIWVAVGNGTLYTIAYSYDGIHWTGVINSKTLFGLDGGVIDVVWNGYLFIAVGAGSTIIAKSSDGIQWNTSFVVIT